MEISTNQKVLQITIFALAISTGVLVFTLMMKPGLVTSSNESVFKPIHIERSPDQPVTDNTAFEETPVEPISESVPPKLLSGEPGSLMAALEGSNRKYIGTPEIEPIALKFGEWLHTSEQPATTILRVLASDVDVEYIYVLEHLIASERFNSLQEMIVTTMGESDGRDFEGWKFVDDIANIGKD